MKIKEELKNLREKTSLQLFTEIENLQKKMIDLRMEYSFGKQKNVKEIAGVRDRIARSWTILNEKALEQLKTQEVTNGK